MVCFNYETLMIEIVNEHYILEDVIRRRLLIDGDGTGDDRRLNILMKNLLKWCSTPNDTTQNNRVMLDRMLAQLTQCEFAVKKSLLVSDVSSEELTNYEKSCEIIKNNIENVKSQIQVALEDLKQAKTVRKNKMEYDILAKVIKEQPDRKETYKKLNELMEELKCLEEKSRQLEKKLDMRRKQFHVLISSANQLRALLDNSDADDLDNSLDIDDLPDSFIEQMDAE